MIELNSKNVMKYCLLAAAVMGCNGTSSSSSPTNDSSSSCAPVEAPASKVLINSDNERYLEEATPAASSNSSGSQAVTLKKLHGHIPAVVKNYSDQGLVSDEQPIPVTVALELNHEADLDQKLSTLYQPGSANYHMFMTPAQFQAQYGPTAEQIAQAQATLKAQGLSGITVSSNNMYIKAMGSASSLGALFHTELHQYKGTDEKMYYAPSYELQVPANSHIKAVLGLQNVTHATKHLLKADTAVAKPMTGSGPQGGLSPSDVRAAYNIPASSTGSGQTLALFELDGYTASDITAYESEFGLPDVPLQNVLIDGSTGAAGSGADEVTLDIELMAAIAPQASKIIVYEGPNDEQGMIDVYARIATDNLAQTVSTSWGVAEDTISASSIQAENTVFKQMAAQGQSVFSASGDSGANDNGSSLSVDDPSSQPYVVGVGGTSLTVGSGGAYQSETTWNDSGGAGGGGVSTVWTIPAWQVGAATGNTLGSTTMRNVPDVSLEADPTNGYAIYVGGSWAVFGGTSCAAPLWAAFMASVNQERMAGGKGLIGFPNALIYGLGKDSRYGTDFHDISDGSTNLYYPAVAGYDDATGWGTINGVGLLEDLSTEAAVSADNPINSCGT